MCSNIWPKIIKIWNPNKALFRSSCTMDVSLFPFDRQNCTLIFSSSTYDARDLEFIGASPVIIDSGAFTQNSEWRLDGCPGHLSVRPGFKPYQMHFFNLVLSWTFSATFGLILNHKNRDTEHGESFHQVVFTFYLTRLPLFYILNIIIPIILMFALSIGVFYLPVDSGEKMTLSISILLGQTVFLFLGRFQTIT